MSSRAQGRLPLATLAGELAEAYPDCRTDFAQSFDQWEASIRDGLRATHHAVTSDDPLTPTDWPPPCSPPPWRVPPHPGSPR